VGDRWHQYDALSIRDSSTGEPADGAVEKILVLIELHDVIAWSGVREHSIPDLRLADASCLTVKLREHRIRLHSSGILIRKFRFESQFLTV
jgi:hypothetical protein